MAEVLAAVEPRLRRLLDWGGDRESDHERQGDEDGEVDSWMAEAPALAELAGASVQGLVAIGRDAGTRVRRLGRARTPVDRPLGRYHARWQGLDLHAGLLIPARQRDRLERVCRYVLRPPVTPERLALTADGQVRVALRHPWGDGTTHVVFDPVDFLGRLAVLVPRPRVNLILYYGVLGARAAWRPEVVPRASSAETPADIDPVDDGGSGRAPVLASPARGRRWADLMRRTFAFDVLACPRCGGRLRLIALIEEAAVIRRILQHLGLPTDPPVPRPARAPPLFAAAGEAQADEYESAP